MVFIVWGEEVKLLNNLTISQKLLIPSAIVVIGFIAIMSVYEYGENIRQEVSQEKQQVIAFYNTTSELQSAVLRAENKVWDFLLHNEMDNVYQYASVMQKIHGHISELETLAPDSDLLAQIHSIKDQLHNYDVIISRLVDSKTNLGLNEKQGLLGELRKAIHEVEHVLAKHNEITLSHSMLMMRRHEKDFLARLSDKYVDQMGEEQQRFATLLAQSPMTKSEKAGIKAKVDFYYQSFLSLVAGQKQVQKDISAAGKVLLNLEPVLQKLMDSSQQVLTNTQQRSEQDIARISTFFYIAFILIALIVVALLLFLSRNITGSLNQLIERMSDLAQGGGDLSRRLMISGKDETARLAELVNRLMENMSILIGKVQQSGIQVASSVAEIAASAKEQEATATEHAATTNQVAASVKEISATSIQLGQTTEEVSHLAQSTAASAADGQKILVSLDATMNRVAEVSNGITDKLAVLNEKASNIGDMVTTINKVADQTNLLSLNAAIEAEKAGEYGRGFAVVATEIRRLADQTAVATYDIEQMVGEVQSAVSAGVMSMDKFSEEIQSSVEEAKKAGVQLENIIHQVQSLAPHIESVNEGLQVQVTGATQIDEAMMSLSEAAQQTAEFARQSTSAISELNEAALALQEGAAIFKVKAS